MHRCSDEPSPSGSVRADAGSMVRFISSRTASGPEGTVLCIGLFGHVNDVLQQLKSTAGNSPELASSDFRTSSIGEMSK